MGEGAGPLPPLSPLPQPPVAAATPAPPMSVSTWRLVNPALPVFMMASLLRRRTSPGTQCNGPRAQQITACRRIATVVGSGRRVLEPLERQPDPPDHRNRHEEGTVMFERGRKDGGETAPSAGAPAAKPAYAAGSGSGEMAVIGRSI